MLDRWAGAALAAVFAVSTASVAAAETPAGKPLTFAIVPKLLDNPVFNYAKLGAEKRARAIGNIRIVWRAPQEADAAKQVEIMESLIAMKVDGIAVSCNEPDALRGVIDRAVAAGIPTITFDSDSPKSKRLTYYGVNDVECGRLLGEALAREIGGKGEVAMLTGMRGAFNLESRMAGVRRALARHRSIRIVQTVACDDDTAKAVSQIEGVMKARPGLAGWALVGGWPLFARGALDSVDAARTRVVSWDALPPEWPYLEAGKVRLLLAQRVFHWGVESVNLLLAARGGTVLPRNSYAGVDLVTPGNLPRYRELWKRWEDPAVRFGEDPLLKP
jgi:ribose transport system substrate-binding protein